MQISDTLLSPFKSIAQSQGYIFLSTWGSHAVEWVKQEKYLVESTSLQILNIVVLVDRIFIGFPKTLANLAQVYRSGSGLIKINTYLGSIGKSGSDVLLAFAQRDISGGLLAILWTARRITDTTLMCFLAAGYVGALGGALSFKMSLFALINPYSIASGLLSFGLEMLDVRLNQALYDDLMQVSPEEQVQFVRSFLTLIASPTNALATKKSSYLSIRTIRQLDSYSLDGYKQTLQINFKDWIPSTKFTQGQLEMAKELFPKIRDNIKWKMWNQGENAGLIFAGYIALSVQKCFPDTVIHSLAETSIGLCWWYKALNQYLEKKKSSELKNDAANADL